MADSATSQFEKMGDPTTIFNNRIGSGERSPYTIDEPRLKGGPTDPMAGVTGGQASRSGTLIHEANGPACTIVSKIDYPNAEGANQQGRNVRLMTRGSQFYAARAAAMNSNGV
jgi:hypothetical protein